VNTAITVVAIIFVGLWVFSGFKKIMGRRK
jgi:hypothetical protein